MVKGSWGTVSGSNLEPSLYAVLITRTLGIMDKSRTTKMFLF